jgi:oleate hydratase
MKDTKVYIVGGGLASLASAAYLIRDGAIPGENITVYEESAGVGGSLDAEKVNAGEGYVMRGYRMLESKVYSCLYDLLSFIPSLHAPYKSVLDEFRDFNERVRITATSRLIEQGKVVESFPYHLQLKDRFRVLWLLTRSENDLQDMTIADYFSPAFFTSNCWVQLCTTFSFQPWHSLVELKRYILRFYHVSPQLSSMECVRLTPYNEYESIVLPLATWLREQGVRFDLNTQVVDFEFDIVNGTKSVRKLHCKREEENCVIGIDAQDLVFATLGSMTANSSIGSMDKAPRENAAAKDPSWLLWENIARKEHALGRPSVFNGDRKKSKWTCFSITFRDPLFVDQLKIITGQQVGTEGVITIKDSNWLISFAMTPYPYFKDQPEYVNVGWGYGLSTEKKGNYVKKKMSECTGREILVELCSHLGMQSHVDYILETSVCIPCLLPYITSQFLPRNTEDRPRVVTKEIANLAILGQFCEIPDDIVFTLEYSVRAAQIGVYSLLHLDKKVTPIYKGYKNPQHVFNIVKTAMTPKVSGEFGRMMAQNLSRAAVVLIGLVGGFYALVHAVFQNIAD